MDTLLAFYDALPPEVLTVLSGILFTVLSLVFGKIVKDGARRAFIEKVVTAGIPVAFHVVDEISRKTDNKIDDKVAAGLGVLKDFLATHGVKEDELTPAHEARAKLLFDALHAQDHKSVVVVDTPEQPPVGA